MFLIYFSWAELSHKENSSPLQPVPASSFPAATNEMTSQRKSLGISCSLWAPGTEHVQTPHLFLLAGLELWNSPSPSPNPACNAACSSAERFHPFSSQLVVLIQLLLFSLSLTLGYPCYSSPTSVMCSCSWICNLPFASATKLLLRNSDTGGMQPILWFLNIKAETSF